MGKAERIIKTAAQIPKGAIKNHRHETNFYPSIDGIGDYSNKNVSDLLKLFVAETIRFPLKQMLISQAIFAASRTRSLMSFQLGLAIETDNRSASE